MATSRLVAMKISVYLSEHPQHLRPILEESSLLTDYFPPSGLAIRVVMTTSPGLPDSESYHSHERFLGWRMLSGSLSFLPSGSKIGALAELVTNTMPIEISTGMGWEGPAKLVYLRKALWTVGE